MQTNLQLAEAAGPPLTGVPCTLRKLLDEASTTHAHKRAVVSMYQAWDNLPSLVADPDKGFPALTYQQLSDAANKITSTLSSTHKIKPGMRVAACLYNSIEFLLLFWASVKLGTVFVSLDARAIGRKDEIRHYFEVTKPSVLLVSDDSAATTLEKTNSQELENIPLKIVMQHSCTINGWQGFRSLLTPCPQTNSRRVASAHNIKEDTPVDKGMVDELQMCVQSAEANLHPLEHNFSNLEKDDIVYIMFTSGTSGLPKACPLTNGNLWAGITGARLHRPVDPFSIVVHHTAPSHAMGMSGLIYQLVNGSTLVIPSPTFDINASLTAIEKFQCTHMNAVPTMILAMQQQSSFHPHMVTSLKEISIGGTIVNPNIVLMASDPEVFGASEVVAGYGLTEVLPVCGSSTRKRLKVDQVAVSVGQLMPGVKARICELGSHKVLNRGDVGELHVSGPQKIGGYLYGDNAAFYTDPSGSWMATGDQARIDEDGDVFILGRYKDIIIRGGECLSPALIESCLDRTGIQAQVISIPDEIAGEVPLAVIQGLESDELPIAEMHDLVMEFLGPTCLPSSYLTLRDLRMESFPLTTSGKVRKDELRNAVLEHLAFKTKSLAENPPVTNSVVEERAKTSLEDLLIHVVSELTGQSKASVPCDQPLPILMDSINIIRFRGSIQKTTGKNVPLDKLLSNIDLVSLARHLQALPCVEPPNAVILERQGLPTAADMVHTRGNLEAALRTEAVAKMLLAKYEMSWADVEAIFPLPEISRIRFEVMRPMDFTIRFSLVIPFSSVSKIYDTLIKTLEQWPIFRSFAIKSDGIPLFMTVRLCDAYVQASITEIPELDSLDDLRMFKHPEAERNHVHLASGSPTARFVIANIKNSGSTGLVILAHHAAFDALSMQAFTQDFRTNLRGEQVTELRTPFKLFADAYYQYSTAQPAQNSVAFHVDRLRGIHSLQKTLWPPQRCADWGIGNDGTERDHIDGDHGLVGMIGISKEIQLCDLVELRLKHVSTPVLFKAACAILTWQASGESEVLFANSQAGRQWPFLDESIARYLPNPVTIAGSTLSMVTNRIQINGSEEVGSFLLRLEEEQRLLTKHCHAPISQITTQLTPEDVATFQAARRQILNWNPNIAAITRSSNSPDDIQLVDIQGFTRSILEWHCGIAGSETAVVLARWDGAQLSKTKVEGWVDNFTNALRWVADVGNWGKSLAEIQSSGSVLTLGTK